MYEDRKIENLSNEYIAQFIDTMHYEVIQVILKLFCRKLGAYYSLNFYI